MGTAPSTFLIKYHVSLFVPGRSTLKVVLTPFGVSGGKESGTANMVFTSLLHGTGGNSEIDVGDLSPTKNYSPAECLM